MALPLQHISGAAWSGCDHWGLAWREDSWSLRLATDQEDAVLNAEGAAEASLAWRAARGGTCWRVTGEDRCVTGEALRIDLNGPLQAARGGVWVDLRLPGGGRALARDGLGRVLWLSADGLTLRALREDDLSAMDQIDCPEALHDICATTEGIYGLSDGQLWFRPEGEDWRTLLSDEDMELLGYGSVTLLSLSAVGEQVLLMAGDTQGLLLATVSPFTVQFGAVEGLGAAAALLAMPGEQALLAELRPLSRGGWRAVFGRYQLVRREGRLAWARLDAWEAVGFRGGGLYLDGEQKPWAAARTAPRRILPRPEVFLGTAEPQAVRGLVETFALDSGRYGCVWHRVFLDLCLPEGCSVRVSARSADQLPDPVLRRDPEPAANMGSPPVTYPPLGSIDRLDRDGWVDLGVLDQRAQRADRPLAPPDAPAWDEPYTRYPDPREKLDFDTFEGLLKNEPGRYLWVRVELLGTRKASPSLVGLRVSYPRPSLLQYLPAFWRADPRIARHMDQWLSLFEAFVVELEGRLELLPLLFDPSITPADALPWLASWLNLSFDARISESVRRQLLSECATLYRQRGTVPGLRRLVQILGECDVEIVEDFRLRRPVGARLGVMPSWEHQVPGAVLGPGLQLAADEGDSGQEDALRAWHRRFAHRFSVLLLRCKDEDLEAVLELAIEANKPAHTVHSICWLEPGLRVGVNSLVGTGAPLGDSSGSVPPDPIVLDQGAPLGGWPDGPATVLGDPSLVLPSPLSGNPPSEESP